jgi:hypothetical protein
MAASLAALGAGYQSITTLPFGGKNIETKCIKLCVSKYSYGVAALNSE